MKIRIAHWISLVALILLSACGEVDYTPKPRLFPKVVFPEHDYKAFDANYCAFTFQQPTYTEIQQDTTFFEDRPKDPCWFDIVYPQFDTKLHCTYQPITKDKSLTDLVAESITMVEEHVVKAEYIDEKAIRKADANLYGMTFDLEGPVATHFQFYLTDSSKHFLRGALYTYARPNPDSLRPVVQFIKEDVYQMINTLEWNE